MIKVNNKDSRTASLFRYFVLKNRNNDVLMSLLLHLNVFQHFFQSFLILTLGGKFLLDRVLMRNLITLFLHLANTISKPARQILEFASSTFWQYLHQYNRSSVSMTTFSSPRSKYNQDMSLKTTLRKFCVLFHSNQKQKI